MNTTLPLYQRPGRFVFLDDDPEYLAMLGMVMPTAWSIELFTRPSAFLARMRDEAAAWEADVARQVAVLDRWRQGQTLLPQVLRYWADTPQRTRLVQRCVVDHAMPGMHGLAVLAQLANWPGMRLLLTGQADQQVAIQAFNQGLIDRFIPKQTPGIARQVQQALMEPAPQIRRALDTLWRTTLSVEQWSWLQREDVARDLKNLLAQRRWVEHAVTGAPFGMLGLNLQGQVEWLQLESPDSLRELAELCTAAGLSAAVRDDVGAGRLLVAAELQTQLGLSGPPRQTPAFMVGGPQGLVGAVFALAPDDLPAPLEAHAVALAECAVREPLDL